MINRKEREWTVWVGAVEVNDNYLTYEAAQNLADEYDDYGDDVVIEYCGQGHCDFCLGENWSEEEVFNGVLVQLEYHYATTGDKCSGQACKHCVNFALNEDDQIIVDFVEEMVTQ